MPQRAQSPQGTDTPLTWEVGLRWYAGLVGDLSLGTTCTQDSPQTGAENFNRAEELANLYQSLIFWLLPQGG